MTDRCFLLDTHVWIWLLAGSPGRLSQSLIDTLEEAAQADRIFVSAISIWELAMLDAKGRIRLPKDCIDWVGEALKAPGTNLVPLSPEIAVASSRLPGDFHGDPADRILVASARVHGLTLITKDERILSYSRDYQLVTCEQA